MQRGITIKAQSVTLNYKSQDGQTYQLNLLIRQGMWIFPMRFQGLLLLVRGIASSGCSSGVEAQTVANCYTAIDLGLEVIPVLNKIDLPQADPDAVSEEIEEIIGVEAVGATCLVQNRSKYRAGLEVSVKDIPAPKVIQMHHYKH